MKVLVVGGGGREHALVWKLTQSSRVEKVYCAPGNGGIARLAECVNIKAEDIEGLLNFVKQENIDLTVVGPEVPLNLGIVDMFEKHGLRIFGPRKNAALLEGSKAFSKDFMEKHGIPTAKYKVYEESQAAKEEIDSFGYPVVIKADGLAAGKGVLIAEDKQQAIAAIEDIMEDKEFGEAGSKVVIEEFLCGKEASILAFVDGKTAVPMVSAQDYKRALDGDKGLNTGGMGAVSPAFHYDDKTAEIVNEIIIKKTVEALRAEGIEYKGVLYYGLILTDKGPKVIEYNARFGDPETEVVLPRLDTDLVDIIDAVIDGKLSTIDIKWKADNAVCVVMASGGYPGEFAKGHEITGLEEDEEDLIVFHAGTKAQNGNVVTNGGRVLVVSALAKDAEAARRKVYQKLETIDFKEKHFRKDIAMR